MCPSKNLCGGSWKNHENSRKGEEDCENPDEEECFALVILRHFESDHENREKTRESVDAETERGSIKEQSPNQSATSIEDRGD